MYRMTCLHCRSISLRVLTRTAPIRGMLRKMIIQYMVQISATTFINYFCPWSFYMHGKSFLIFILFSPCALHQTSAGHTVNDRCASKLRGRWNCFLRGGVRSVISSSVVPYPEQHWTTQQADYTGLLMSLTCNFRGLQLLGCTYQTRKYDFFFHKPSFYYDNKKWFISKRHRLCHACSCQSCEPSYKVFIKSCVNRLCSYIDQTIKHYKTMAL